jgi:hypothetical protein
MKLLLVLGSDNSCARISLCVKPLKYELIRYNHVLKAMDNIDEVDPQAIVISARDFPRHWKAMSQFVRYERSKDSCPIIILKGENFPHEEASKAACLDVNGVFAETLDIPDETDRLRKILGRYAPPIERGKPRCFPAGDPRQFGFVFINPSDNTLVTGEPKNISPGGLLFQPDNPASIKNIDAGEELKECSLRAGASILSPVCRLVRTGGTAAMEFISFPEQEREAFVKYLESLCL